MFVDVETSDFPVVVLCSAAIQEIIIEDSGNYLFLIVNSLHSVVKTGEEGVENAFIVSKTWFVLIPDVCSVCGPDTDAVTISEVGLATE